MNGRLARSRFVTDTYERFLALVPLPAGLTIRFRPCIHGRSGARWRPLQYAEPCDWRASLVAIQASVLERWAAVLHPTRWRGARQLQARSHSVECQQGDARSGCALASDVCT